MSLTLDQARIIIAAALATGRAANMQPLSVLVLDAGGAPLAFEREDNSPPGRYNVVFGKANACIQMGTDGKTMVERQQSNQSFWQALPNAFDGAFLPNPGGMLIRDQQGQVIGAVGVSGCTSANDREAALAGIAAAGLKTNG